VRGGLAPVSADAVVFVVDDDASVRRSLARLLHSAGFEVEAFASAEDFLSATRPERPSCLVLDLHMPGIGGLDLQHRLAAAGLDPAIVFLSGHGTVPSSVRAMKAGAVDFIQKPFDGPDLLAAVGRAVDRDRGARVERREREQVQVCFDVLTPREREVAVRLARGLTNRAIADDLVISAGTAERHVTNILNKLGYRSRAQIAVWAGEHGLLGNEPS